MIRVKKNIVFIIFLFLLPLVTLAEINCEKWFLEWNIRPGSKNCEIECVTAPYSLANFDCGTECLKFCKTYIPRDKLDNHVYFDSLTPKEKDLVAKFPKEALQVYMAKEYAQEITRKLF